MEKVGGYMKRDIQLEEDVYHYKDNLSTECIVVPKVFDWFIHSNHKNQKIPIPESCYDKVKPFLRKCKKITASCREVPNKRFCEVIDEKPVSVDRPDAKLVTLSQHFVFCIELCDEERLVPHCSFTVPVNVIDSVILCYPACTHIYSEVTEITCHAIVNERWEDMLVLDFFFCQEITVEAEVKLEIEAKYCKPRKEIPVEDIAYCQHDFIPDQCSGIFPSNKKECHGSASAYREKTKVRINDILVYGELTMDYKDHTLEVNFRALSCKKKYGKQSFAFFSTSCQEPSCDDSCHTLTVTGEGELRISKHYKMSAYYKLILDQQTNTFSLVVKDKDSNVDLVIIKNSKADVDIWCKS